MATKTYCDSCEEEIHGMVNEVSVAHTTNGHVKPTAVLELCNVCWPKLAAVVRRIKDGRLNLREMVLGVSEAGKQSIHEVEV